MSWKIKTLDIFDNWFKDLKIAEQEDIAAAIYLLEDQGANLSRPYADTIKGSAYKNMKELEFSTKENLIGSCIFLTPKDKVY